MKPALIPIAVILLTSGAGPAATQTPATRPPTTAAAEVTECAQAQLIVDRLLEAATTRIEASRQTNNPADMRATVDSLQQTLRDVRAQLAPCAKLQPSDLHGPHVMPKPPASPSPPSGAPMAAPTKPPAAADPHAGHVTTPAAPAGKPLVKPAPMAAKPAPSVKPPASDPHAGHTPSAPAKGARPAAKAAPSAAKPAPQPPAQDPHAGHTPAAPATPAQPPEKSPAEAVDPVCGLKVDSATAPRASYQGRTYYFCSEQHQQLFQKNAAKYLPRGKS